MDLVTRQVTFKVSWRFLGKNFGIFCYESRLFTSVNESGVSGWQDLIRQRLATLPPSPEGKALGPLFCLPPWGRCQPACGLTDEVTQIMLPKTARLCYNRFTL